MRNQNQNVYVHFKKFMKNFWAGINNSVFILRSRFLILLLLDEKKYDLYMYCKHADAAPGLHTY